MLWRFRSRTCSPPSHTHVRPSPKHSTPHTTKANTKAMKSERSQSLGPEGDKFRTRKGAGRSKPHGSQASHGHGGEAPVAVATSFGSPVILSCVADTTAEMVPVATCSACRLPTQVEKSVEGAVHSSSPQASCPTKFWPSPHVTEATLFSYSMLTAWGSSGDKTRQVSSVAAQQMCQARAPQRP
eukprot:999139-Rhodomonas_salina.2